MAWCTVLLTFFLQRKFTLSVPFGFLLCGLTLLVSMFGEQNPQITQLMPVLQSPLLSIHVVAIMTAYSLLAFIMLNGITAVVLHYSTENCETAIDFLQRISRLILYPAVFLLTIGIFIGAVWANVSWGRYWGWDPERSVGTYHHAGLRAGTAPASLKWFRYPMFFSCIWHCGVPHCINHLFWSEFSARRHAQLCQWIKRMKRSIATMHKIINLQYLKHQL